MLICIAFFSLIAIGMERDFSEPNYSPPRKVKTAKNKLRLCSIIQILDDLKIAFSFRTKQAIPAKKTIHKGTGSSSSDEWENGKIYKF